MIKTKFTEMFGVKYPIIQSGMQWLGVPEFASVVCNAGGMGTINTSCWDTPEELREALEHMNTLTSKPYIVNISITPGLAPDLELIRKYISACKDNHVACIETAAGDPREFMGDIHAAGIRHLHKCPNMHVSKSMEKKGVDLVTIAGYEVAGHPSADGVGTFVIARRVASQLKIPVIAAGGIADGHGLAAALSLGASAVAMGTRFVATEECPLSDNHKQWILDHTEKNTVLAQRKIGSMMRVSDNNAARLANAMEENGATIKELFPIISGKLTKQAFKNGNVDSAIFCAGQAMGLIDDIVPVKTLIDRMVKEAEETLDSVRSCFVED